MSHTHSPPRKYHISRSISRSPRHTNSTSTAKSSSPSRADSKSIDTVYQFEKFISEEEENEDENLIFRSRPKGSFPLFPSFPGLKPRTSLYIQLLMTGRHRGHPHSAIQLSLIRDGVTASTFRILITLMEHRYPHYYLLLL